MSNILRKYHINKLLDIKDEYIDNIVFNIENLLVYSKNIELPKLETRSNSFFGNVTKFYFNDNKFSYVLISYNNIVVCYHNIDIKNINGLMILLFKKILGINIDNSYTTSIGYLYQINREYEREQNKIIKK